MEDLVTSDAILPRGALSRRFEEVRNVGSLGRVRSISSGVVLGLCSLAVALSRSVRIPVLAQWSFMH